MDRCRICSADNLVFGAGRILNNYDIKFYKCTSCGFVQTETPFWLEEAYSEAINYCDIGLLGRNFRLAKLVKVLLCSFFDSKGTFLDYGGGYGTLVRLMRDQGFDFYRYDKYCKNIFAHGFDVSGEEKGTYELVTAFEFFEHVHDPVEELENLLAYSDNVFFTTEIVPEPAPQPGSWWYYGLEHGQHVSFYTERALRCLAERFSLRLYSARGTYHLLTRKEIHPRLYRWLFKKRITALLDRFYKMKSLRYDDFRKISGMSIK